MSVRITADGGIEVSGQARAAGVLYDLRTEDIGLSPCRDLVHTPRLPSVPAWVGAGRIGLRPATVHEPGFAATLAAFAGGEHRA